MEDFGTWDLEEGEELSPGLFALTLLGGGTRHEAYLAWAEHHFTTVVAKVLRPGCATDSRSVSDLRREAGILGRLNHPVLPRCLGTHLGGNRPHLVMELLDGPRLSTLVRRHGPLAIEQAIPLALELCSALRYLNAEGLVHLDVKPKNVIMGAPPRLLDLSIARTVEEARGAVGPLGTDAYMAPEQCGVAGMGEMGPPSDVWGIGVTLYEALTGRRPFPDAEDPHGANGRYPQLMADPAPFPKYIPKELAGPVMACLRRRPEERPTVEEVAWTLQPLGAVLPTPRVIPKLRLGSRAPRRLDERTLTAVSRPSQERRGG